MKRRQWIPTGVALLVAAGLAPGPTEAQQAPMFKVGVVTSLSGEMNFGGGVTKRGYDLWADTVNAAGG
ncbi:MAG TPA: ABC transporter substrate-binding protein, partial [Candidatus Methylomirabilis sp.]|nr:ABC transporter substrate-binding protein [Candidatus Methylomirabilis sp.]